MEVGDDERRIARSDAEQSGNSTNGVETGQSSSGVSKQPRDASVSGCESTACGVAGGAESRAEVFEAHLASLAESKFNPKEGAT